MIATVWVLAFAVSCPLLFGFNTTGEVASFRGHPPSPPPPAPSATVQLAGSPGDTGE